MENSFFVNLNREINSPLNQFDIREFVSITVNVLGNLNIAITNIAIFLTMSGFYLLFSNLLSTNYNKVVGNSWSISQESLYATIHSIVTNQINYKNGQMYFPFIYALFIFILINNLIGMVNRCLRNSWLIISSNLLKKLYSTISYYQYRNISYNISKNQVRYSFNNKNTFYLNPDYITGFVDGEGCFSISIFKDSRRLTGWQVKPIFSISLHNKDINLLEAIQRTFNVGKIYKHGIDSIQYRVSSLNDLQVITDHFDEYPLITQKQADYILFKQAINLIYNKEHLSSIGLLKLVGIKSTLNWGLPEKFKESFPTIEPITRPNIDNANIRNSNWVRGFIEAEASFQVIIQEINNKVNVSLRFSITQHVKDKLLLNSFITYLNCGRYYKSPIRNEGQYLVTTFSDIKDKIIPLLKEYPLLGVKKEDYSDLVKVAELIKSKDHLTEEGISLIRTIKNNMNSKRILIKE
jgi:hypothetical protein